MTQTTLLFVAALLSFAVGLAHSVLGEKYILMRLLRRPELPKLFGDTTFTARTLRFAWHLTTIAWWGFGAMLVLASRGLLSAGNTLLVLGATMAATAVMILVASRGRHLAWPVFLVIALIAFWAAA
jgi:hypothetical protein